MSPLVQFSMSPDTDRMLVAQKAASRTQLPTAPVPAARGHSPSEHESMHALVQRMRRRVSLHHAIEGTDIKNGTFLRQVKLGRATQACAGRRDGSGVRPVDPIMESRFLFPFRSGVGYNCSL
jgi:hypothetical protein